MKKLFLAEDDLKAPVLQALCSLEVEIPDSFLPALEGRDVKILLAVAGALEGCDNRGGSIALALAEHENLDVACTALRVLAVNTKRTRNVDDLLIQMLREGVPEKVKAILRNLRF